MQISHKRGEYRHWRCVLCACNRFDGLSRHGTVRLKQKRECRFDLQLRGARRQVENTQVFDGRGSLPNDEQNDYRWPFSTLLRRVRNATQELVIEVV